MDDNNVNCSVCRKQYSDERHPLSFTCGCGHVICSQCLEQVAVSNLTCLKCQELLHLARTEDYVVAFAPNHFAPHNISRPGRDRDPRQNAGECPRHGSPMFFRCLTCSLWVCHDCVVVDHREPPHGSCNILGFLEALESMKSTAIHDTKKKLQSVEKSSTILKGTLNCTNSKISKYEKELQNILNNIQAEKDKVRRLNEKLRWTMQVEERLVDATQRLVNTCTNEGLSGALQEVEDHMATLVIESPGKQTLVELLDDGVDLYMTQNLAQQMRFGRITKQEDKLLLGALHDGSPPSNGISLPFEGVRRLVPRESPWVYLEVGWQDQYRGTVYIQLYGDTPRARQMALLCSGEVGPSYRGTTFYEHGKNPDVEWIWGGDYEYNDGTGGPAIVQGITDGGEYRRTNKAGHLVGVVSTDVNRLGNFFIILNDNPKRNNRTTHGKVMSGLDILLEASHLSQIKESIVTNCGLVIPLDETGSEITKLTEAFKGS